MLAVLSAKEDSLRELDSIEEEHTLLEDVEAVIELAEAYRDYRDLLLSICDITLQPKMFPKGEKVTMSKKNSFQFTK